MKVQKSLQRKIDLQAKMNARAEEMQRIEKEIDSNMSFMNASPQIYARVEAVAIPKVDQLHYSLNVGSTRIHDHHARMK